MTLILLALVCAPLLHQQGPGRRAAPTHTCPVRKCSRQVPDHLLMCAPHWNMVPGGLQRAVYAAWDHGRGRNSMALFAAQTDAIVAVNAKLDRGAPPLGFADPITDTR